MAKKGIRYCVFGERNEADGTYSNGAYLSPVVNFTGTPNNSNVKDYGDDRCVEVANETIGGTLSIELNNDDKQIFALVLGHTLTDGEVVYSTDDQAPYVGVGAIGKSGAEWRAIFYPKVLFAEPTDENTTKQESTTFGHITLEGDIVPLEDGTWKKDKRFSTLADAKSYLNALVGIQESNASGDEGDEGDDTP